MVNEARKAELEVMAPLYLQALCEGAGLAASGSKSQLINRLLKSEGQVSEPAEPEPAEPGEPAETETETEPGTETETEPGTETEGTGEGGGGSEEP